MKIQVLVNKNNNVQSKFSSKRLKEQDEDLFMTAVEMH